MSWHAAQIGFVLATVVVVMGTLLASAYVVSTVAWSERWVVRRDRQMSRP